MMENKTHLTRHHSTEKDVAQSLQGSFEIKNSRGLKLIEELFNNRQFDTISRNSLLSLTIILSTLTQIPFPRNFSRRKALIVKWFDTNYDILSQTKPFVNLEFVAKHGSV